MSARTSAPGQLGLLEDFLRTRNEVTTVADLGRWTQQRAMPGRVTAATYARAMQLREALRAMMLANNGGPSCPDALRLVNAEIQACAITPTVRAPTVPAPSVPAPSVPASPHPVQLDWAARPGERAEGGATLLVAVLTALLTALADGSWPRMKACAADDCRYAFYDHTRNHSGRWCDVSGCGVRARMRTYRQRSTGAGLA